MYLRKLVYKWIEHGPKNKYVYYLLYAPAMLLGSIGVIFLLMGIPELIAWAFGAACVIWVVIWPLSKVYELITGKKIL